MLHCFLTDSPTYKKKNEDDIIRYKTNPIIVHYSGNIKPWDCWMNNPFYNEYFYICQKLLGKIAVLDFCILCENSLSLVIY